MAVSPLSARSRSSRVRRSSMHQAAWSIPAWSRPTIIYFNACSRACAPLLHAVPYSYWHKFDEEALRTAARVGLAELLLSGTTTAADHHYLYADSYRFDPSHVIFEVAQELGMRLVFCRGGATKARKFDTPDLIPTPAEPLDRMIKSVEACAQRYHDPSPDGMRRVAFAPTTPPWSLEAEELKVVASAARRMGLRIHGHLSETS